MAIGHVPELLRVAFGPVWHVPMTGVDQVTTSAVRSLSFDVDRVSTSTAFLAALDAVVEACHL
ncbi:hypothetical protein D3C81_2225410 [compost metagenome]